MEETSRLGWDTLMLYIQNTGKLPDVVAVPNPEGEDKWPLALTPVIAFGQMWEYIQSKDEQEHADAEASRALEELHDRYVVISEELFITRSQRDDVVAQLTLLTTPATEVDDSI